MGHLARPQISAGNEVLAISNDGRRVLTGSSSGKGARFHRERAERFSRYASRTQNPGTREMYLRLAESEVALAERCERLEKQARADTEVGSATPKAPRGSSPRHK